MLVKLLLKQHFCIRREIHFRTGAPKADACVVIGDRALQAERALISYDLAAEWKNMTALPFVFAVWAYWNDLSDSRGLSKTLHAAKDMGCRSIAKLAKIYAKRIGLSEARCRHYLASCIKYDIGPAEKSSIKLFRELSGSLMKTHEQTIKDKSIKIQRIVRNEHKSQTIEPTLTQLK
jgi:chorismate dehydratase